MNKANWIITQEQIANGNIDDIVRLLDPAVILNDEIYGLAGAVRLRVEAVTKPADLFTNPQARRFFRALHTSWPWAGYFLRLHAITADSPTEQIIDTSLFMTLLFCRLNELTYAETAKGVALRYDADQLRQYLNDLRQRAAELASLAGIPDAQIQQRDELILKSVASFFAAGRSVNRPSSRRRNQ